MALSVKRKRSSDAVSDAGTTDASTPGRELDDRSQLLAQQREEHAAAKLELEQLLMQAQQQKEHVAMQLDQLEGCEGSGDLRSQLQSYAQQEQQAQANLVHLDRQFEAAVSHILGIPAEQQPRQLAAALEQQQQLQQAQLQQMAVEQQLAGHDFAVSNATKHLAKKARADRLSQVWDWLQGSAPGDVTSQTAVLAAGGPRLVSAASGLSSDAALEAAGNNGHAVREWQPKERGAGQSRLADQQGDQQQQHQEGAAAAGDRQDKQQPQRHSAEQAGGGSVSAVP